MSSSDSLEFQSYSEIRKFELLLRRLVRWELSGYYGRKWLSKLDKHLDSIAQVENYEKRLNIFDPRASELSYLTLGALLRIIFYDHWSSVFDRVFTSDRGLFKLITNNILPVRNRIAHFRTITYRDKSSIALASEISSGLKRYYDENERIVEFLSSDPELISEQVDPEVYGPVLARLQSHGLNEVWEIYGMIEGIRTHGISLGLGIGQSHFFLETRWLSDPPKQVLNEWAHNNRYAFTTIVSSEKTVRFFYSLRADTKDLKKSIKSIGTLPESCRLSRIADLNSTFSDYIIDSKQTDLTSMGF